MKYLEDTSLAALSRLDFPTVINATRCIPAETSRPNPHSHSQLTTISPESSLHARIEAYSCKPTTKDRKLYRSVDNHWEDEIAFKASAPNHPSTATILDSPFGSLDQPSARRTFCLLIATLNVAFPDHDFSDISPDEFTREYNAGAPILNALSNALTAPGSSSPSSSRNISSRSFAAFPASYTESPKDEMMLHGMMMNGSGAGAGMTRSASPVTSVLHQLSSASSSNTSPASNTHPALFRILNDVINLSECEVYSYAPDVYSDPHGGSDSDEDSLADSEDDSSDGGWEWDDYDVDDAPLTRSSDSMHGGGLGGGSKKEKEVLDPWELSSSPDRDVVFPFFDDEKRKSSSSSPSASLAWSPRRPTSSSNTSGATPISRPSHSSYPYTTDSYEDSTAYRTTRQRRRKGSLLWSSHWFFYHRKDKKILFVSLWARQREWTRGGGFELSSSAGMKAGEESFGGWEGAEGTGARAFEFALEGRGRM